MSQFLKTLHSHITCISFIIKVQLQFRIVYDKQYTVLNNNNRMNNDTIPLHKY